MSTRPRFFLLDAGPVIELHRLGLWQEVLTRAHIILPRVIAEHETEYWVRDNGTFPLIRAIDDAEAGRLTLGECSDAELRATFEGFDPVLQQSVDPGELHALTLLRLWDEEPVPRFCSADRMAVVALCLLRFANLANSLQALLADLGLQKTLKWRFTNRAMDTWLREGRRRRMENGHL